MISSPQSNEATAKSDDSPRTNGHTTTTPPQPEQRGARSSGNGGGPGPKEGERRNWWQRSSLKTKATTLAIALGTIPVLIVGATDYFLAGAEIKKDIALLQEEAALALGDQVGRFIYERFADSQTLSGLRSFSDPKVSQITTRQEKEAQLNRFQEVYKSYDSIAVFSLDGSVLAKSKGQVSNNIRDQAHFQDVLKTDAAVITQPEKSRATGKTSIFIATPIKNTVTNKTIAVLRTRLPAEVIEQLIETEEARLEEVVTAFEGSEWHLIDSRGKFFLATEKEQVGRDARSDFAAFAQMDAAKKVATDTTVDQVDSAEQLISYAPVEEFEGMPKLNWSVVIAEDAASAFASQRQLLLNLLIGTALTALVVSAIALYLARRATRPITDAADAVKKLGQGQLDTRVAVEGEDELAELGTNINLMAGQIQNLIVEQAESTRQQLADQEEAGRQQEENAEQQRLGKENLQKRALELLIEVDPVSRGDLTIRANVTEDEIGTVADSYNATIGSLRKIVAQVQTSARQMADTTSTSEVSVQGLSVEALRQTEEITGALDQLQEMSNAIRAVAANAEQAEAAVQQANQTVSEGDAAMNRTVEGIVAIRETVAETSKKVKRLGESSQKISRVVNLIGKFADQTNLLALNASIEAALAGAEGRGFAVVANEVRSLARQSAEATAEIEKLVANIQIETNEVVAAMETGTEQVVTGTKLVDETRQSLNKITAVSTQISGLVQAIAQAAAAQSKASESVTLTMTDVAAISNKTSAEANKVSTSFKDLLAVAQELQTSAGQFKVS